MEGQEEMKVRDRFDKNRIGDLVCDGAFKYVQNFAVEINGKRVAEYDSLDGVVEDWEDYTPAEPLIKDEKIRKAVRAWYDAIDYRVDNLLCIKTSGNTRLEISDGSPKLIYISLFVDKGTLANIKDRTYCTIAELCGEEEE